MSKTAKILLLTSLLSAQNVLIHANLEEAVSKPVIEVVKKNGFMQGVHVVAKNIGTGVYGIAKVIGSAVVGTSQLVAKLDVLGNLAKKNPRTTAAIGLLTAGISLRTAYSYYYGKDYTTVLDQAKKYTKYLDDNPQIQAGKSPKILCVWRNAPGMKNVDGCPAFFEAPFDIDFAKDSIWPLLKADRELMFSVKGDDAAYKKAVLLEISKERDILKGILASISKSLWSNRFSFSGDPVVFDLISDELQHINNLSLSTINKGDIKKITNEIESLYSLFWPSNIVAQIYDPRLQQRELAEQYWKLLICIARLDAMQKAVAAPVA
jgi:hypothetical protein